MATQDVWQSMSATAAGVVARLKGCSNTQEQIADVPALLRPAVELPRGRSVLKRSVDLVFSCLVLVLVAPILLVIAMGIRLDSPGPVLYVSERIGRYGRRFGCFKFRTMVENAEQLQDAMQSLNERDSVFFKIANDPRVTRVGRILRKYSLDELPQFFNVLRGEMSVVGPRPPLASEVQEYSASHLRRLTVLPGITGLWQTQARHDPSFESYVSLDLAYIEHWSIGLDLKIIAQTVFILLSGTGI